MVSFEGGKKHGYFRIPPAREIILPEKDNLCAGGLEK
jgi:hypothetical protein